MPCPADMRKALCDLRPDLMRLAHALTGAPDQAQDLCQDVLLKLWVRLQDDHEIQNLRAYAMTAMRNQYRQGLRLQPATETMTEDMATRDPDVFAILALQELGSAMQTLTAPQARLIRLVAQGETSPRSLAETTGWPLGTVMSRLARARAKLRSSVGLGEKSPTNELL